jgi:hypothetical protein
VATRSYTTSGDTITGRLDKIVKNTIQDINDIQRQTYFDARDLIRRLECLGPPAAELLKDTVEDVLHQLSETTFEVKIPVFGTVRGDIIVASEEFSFQTPEHAYENIKLTYLNAIHEMGESSNVITLTSYYTQISRMAKKTLCVSQDLRISNYYLAEVAHYESMVAPWFFVTGLD